MDREEFYGRVQFSLSTGLVPWGDPSEYVHYIVGAALDLEENPVGTLNLQLVSTTEAMNNGENLFDVFDAESGTLEAIYSTLFDANGWTREEFDIEPGWNNLLFIDEVEIKPEHECTSLRVQLIETGIAMFCPEGLVVAIEESLKLPVDEWRQLGFRRIADSVFVLRDQLKVNPYQESTAQVDAEVSYTCAACGEEIVIPVDFTEGPTQEYVEDCPVCCRANVIHVEIDVDGSVTVSAELEQDEE